MPTPFCKSTSVSQYIETPAFVRFWCPVGQVTVTLPGGSLEVIQDPEEPAWDEKRLTECPVCRRPHDFL